MATFAKKASSRLPVFMSVSRPRSPYGTLMARRWVLSHRLRIEYHLQPTYFVRDNICRSERRQTLRLISMITKVINDRLALCEIDSVSNPYSSVPCFVQAPSDDKPVLTEVRRGMAYLQHWVSNYIEHQLLPNLPYYGVLVAPSRFIPEMRVSGFLMHHPWDMTMVRKLKSCPAGEVLVLGRDFEDRRSRYSIVVPAILRRRSPRKDPTSRLFNAVYALFVKKGVHSGFSSTFAPFSVR
jgi:hypothetical protein